MRLPFVGVGITSFGRFSLGCALSPSGHSLERESMPYIDQEHRDKLDPHIEGLTEILRNMGDLNYTITKLCDAYLSTEVGIRYARINDLIGALECAKLELYRRVAAPYEDTKVTQNGDVYDSLTDDLMPPPVRASDIPVETPKKQKKGLWKKILGS